VVRQQIKHRAYADDITAAHGRVATRRRAEIEGLDRPAAGLVHALETHRAGKRRRHQSAGQADDLAEAALAGQLVDRGPLHLAGDGHGRAARRHEQHVVRHQARIAAIIAVEQQVIQVESLHQLAVALQLHVAQRADRADPAADEQRVGHRREAADRERARPCHIAQHEDTDRAQLAHRDTDVHADHLVRDTLLDEVSHLPEIQPGDHDRADLREVQAAVTVHHQRVVGALLAEQLHAHLVARPQRVIGRHRHIGGRREGHRRALEELVAKRFEDLRPETLQRQQHDLGFKNSQVGLGLDAASRLELGQAGERNAGDAWEMNPARLVQHVGGRALDGFQLWIAPKRLLQLALPLPVRFLELRQRQPDDDRALGLEARRTLRLGQFGFGRQHRLGKLQLRLRPRGVPHAHRTHQLPALALGKLPQHLHLFRRRRLRRRRHLGRNQASYRRASTGRRRGGPRRLCKSCSSVCGCSK
jgi:hypothetical protein